MVRHLCVILLNLLLSVNILAQNRLFNIADGLHNNQVRQIVELPNGQILVANEGAFSVYDGYRFQPVECCLDSIYELPSFGCHDFCWVGDSLLFIKNYYNLFIYDAKSMCFRYDYKSFIKDRKIQQFISINNATRKLECIDRQGGKWIVDEMNGIKYQSPLTVKGVEIPLDNLSADDHIRHLVSVGDSQLLMASDKSIFIYDTKLGTISSTLVEGEIHCSNINVCADKSVWISTNQGLYYYKFGILKHFDSSNSSGFLHDHMRFAYSIDGSRVLVCNLLHHLGYFLPYEGQFVLLNNTYPELDGYRTMIDACPLDNNGRILVATQNGVFVFNSIHEKIEHPDYLRGIGHFSNKFNCLLRDTQERIWIGTQNGLFVLIPQLSPTGMNKSFILRHISMAMGLSNTCIKSIAEAPNGNIYVGTAYGLNKIAISSDDMKVTSYGVSDGIPEMEICERGMCIMPDGNLYFSTDKNLVMFNTNEKKRTSQSLEVNIVGVCVNDSVWPMCKGLTLDYDQNNITLRLSSLNYANPAHTRYRYRLVGINDMWTEVRDGKDIVVAQYLSLSPGRYTFEIQSAEDDSSWGPVTKVEIAINPLVWMTWWAITLYIIVILIASYKAISLYLNHRKKIMEAENEMRINKLFELQSQARHQFAQNTNVTTENIEDRANEELIARMNKAIAENIDNCDYTVDNLAADIGMSRASLYKKAQQALGITPNDYLRNVRLKHATTLLEQGIPVSQVALMVGFMTPRYFSQCFKSLFGVSPSEYSVISKRIER